MEIEVAGHKYRTGKLNAFEQFNVVRRIAPLLSGLGESFAKIPRPTVVIPNGHDTGEPVEAEPPTQDQEANVWSALGPVAEALSNMPDDHVNYVLKLCISKCHRFDENAHSWARIATSAGDLTYADIDASIMMQIVFNTIQENLESFFSAPLLQTSGEDLGSR